MLEDPNVVAWLIKTQHLKGLKNIGCTKEILPEQIGLSKKSKHFAYLSKALRHGIKAANASGEIKQLIQKYEIKTASK